MGQGTVVSLISEMSKDKNNKKLNRELKNAPKYKISNETYENQSIARSQAFGRDRSIQAQQENLKQDAVNSASQAQDVTSSTSGLLSTIAAINANSGNASRALAQDEAVLKNQKVQQLYDVNNQVIDEKDKAWNYNTNMPYQMKIAALRDKIQSNTEMSAKGVDYEASTSSSFMSSMGGGMMSDERVKNSVKSCERGIDTIMMLNPVEFEYDFDPSVKHIGLMAQQVMKLVPEAVCVSDQAKTIGLGDNILQINYNELVPILIKGIQDQQTQIEYLKTEVKNLKGN